MHALFVSVSTDIGIESPHVYLFDNESAATQFAVTALVEARLLVKNPDGTIYSSDRQEAFGTWESALEAFQDELGGSEYFHVYNTTEPRQDGE